MVVSGAPAGGGGMRLSPTVPINNEIHRAYVHEPGSVLGASRASSDSHKRSHQAGLTSLSQARGLESFAQGHRGGSVV